MAQITIRLGGVDRVVELPDIVEGDFGLTLDDGVFVSGHLCAVDVRREPWTIQRFEVEWTMPEGDRTGQGDREGLTAEQLGRLDWAGLMAQVVLDHHIGLNWPGPDAPPLDQASLEELHLEPSRSVLPELRSRAYTKTSDVDLDRVAELYASDPDKPRRAVMDGMHVSKSTASRWIALAREEGRLR